MYEIFQLAYHSQGGFTHDEVYSMPSAKRRYYLNLLLEQKKKEEKQPSTAPNKKSYNIPTLPSRRKS